MKELAVSRPAPVNYLQCRWWVTARVSIVDLELVEELQNAFTCISTETGPIDELRSFYLLFRIFEAMLCFHFPLSRKILISENLLIVRSVKRWNQTRRNARTRRNRNNELIFELLYLFGTVMTWGRKTFSFIQLSFSNHFRICW